MASGLDGAPRTALKVLLWLTALVIVAVLTMTIGMEYEASRDGGGEMVHTIGLFLALIVMTYYAIVLMIGRVMLRKGRASWGWHLVTVMLVLVFLPMIALWKLVSA